MCAYTPVEKYEADFEYDPDGGLPDPVLWLPAAWQPNCGNDKAFDLSPYCQQPGTWAGTTAQRNDVTDRGRAFRFGGDDYQLFDPPATVKPLTFLCNFRVDNTTDDHVLIAISDEGAASDWFRLFASGDTQDNRLVANIKHNNDASAISSNQFTAGVWHHGAAVFEPSRVLVYLDDVETVLNDTRVPTGIDNCTIGVLKYSSLARYVTGSIRDAVIIPAVLSPTQIHDHRISTLDGSPGVMARPIGPRWFPAAVAGGVTVTPTVLSATASLVGTPPIVSRTMAISH